MCLLLLSRTTSAIVLLNQASLPGQFGWVPQKLVRVDFLLYLVDDLWPSCLFMTKVPSIVIDRLGLEMPSYSIQM